MINISCKVYKNRVSASSRNSLKVLDISVKFQGPEKPWKITFVLEIAFDGLGKYWNIDMLGCEQLKYLDLLLI